MEKRAERVYRIRFAYRVIAAAAPAVETAHMPIYRKRLRARQTHISVYDINGFFAVPVGKFFFPGVVRFFHPFIVRFDVAEVLFVVVDLADVVEQPAYGYALFGDIELLLAFRGCGAFRCDNGGKLFVYVYAVFAQSAAVAAMEFAACRRGEKVGAAFKIFEQIVRAFPRYMRFVDPDKFLFVIFGGIVDPFVRSFHIFHKMIVTYKVRLVKA